ncbi:MAG: TonB family protein [Thermoanaerobaculia bacterium]|nr:TonB family protein [Thermoanaerobaculia bacterium]
MFETVVVESRVQPIRRTRVAVLPVSLGLHGLAVSAAILSSIWGVVLPMNAPPQFESFQGMRPAPAMPEVKPQVRVDPPPKGEPPKTPASVFTQAPISNPTVQTPEAIPDTIPEVGPAGSSLPEIAVAGPGSSGSPTGSEFVGTEPIQVGPGSATMPVVRVRVQPEYPELLTKMGLRGTAIVECIVGEDGVITSATVVKATHPLFGESARNAVMKWKFLPGRLNGQPVATIFQLTVTFEVRR